MSAYYIVWHTLMPNFVDAWWEKVTNLLNDEAKFISQKPRDIFVIFNWTQRIHHSSLT